MVNNLYQLEETIPKLRPSERGRTLQIAIQEAYKNSLYLTATELLGYDQIRRDTHTSIIKALESDTKRKLLVMPRGTFKSTIAVVSYCVWCLIKNPNERILIDSEIYGNSITYLREIKNHLESERLIRLFGQFKTKTWNEGEIIIAQRTANKKESSITCGAVGTTRVGQHYSIIIADDYNSPRNSSSPEQRQKIINHFQFNQAILDPNGIAIVVGTRYHSEDLIGWLLKNQLAIKDFRDKNDLKGLHQDEGVLYA